MFNVRSIHLTYFMIQLDIFYDSTTFKLKNSPPQIYCVCLSLSGITGEMWGSKAKFCIDCRSKTCSGQDLNPKCVIWIYIFSFTKPATQRHGGVEEVMSKVVHTVMNPKKIAFPISPHLLRRHSAPVSIGEFFYYLFNVLFMYLSL